MRWLGLTLSFVVSALAVIALIEVSRNLLPERPEPARPIVLVPATTLEPPETSEPSGTGDA